MAPLAACLTPHASGIANWTLYGCAGQHGTVDENCVDVAKPTQTNGWKTNRGQVKQRLTEYFHLTTVIIVIGLDVYC